MSKTGKTGRTVRTVNREHKSTLFAYLFSNAEDALALYNAVNGTDYDDPSGLEFNTLENVLYMGMKNDISFLFGTKMNLYEHQSTWNPNMPLRGVFYLSALYKKYLTANGLDIYSSTRLSLPTPRFVVFVTVQTVHLLARPLAAQEASDGHPM